MKISQRNDNNRKSLQTECNLIRKDKKISSELAVTFKKKVCIISAGPAVLTAGYRLLKLGKGHFDVCILEASNTVGGISRTVCHHGNLMDIGGHRFFSKVQEINDMWHEIMPLQGEPAMDDRKLCRLVPLHPGGPNPEKTDCVMLLRNRISRSYYQRKFFDYPIRINIKTIRNMGLWITFCVMLSYLNATITRLPEKTLEDFYINRFGLKLYSMFFESYTEKLWGRHPRNISSEWGAQRVKGLCIPKIAKDIFNKMMPNAWRKNMKTETSLNESFQYPKYCPGQLWQTVASRFESKGGKIIFNAKVNSLKKEGSNDITTIICKHNNVIESHNCDYVISSMPLKELIAGLDNVPANICKIASGLPHRDFVIVGLLLDHINLKNETRLKTLGNIVPDCWIYVQDTRVRLGRIQIFNNWSPYMVQSPESTIWIGLEYFCNDGDGTWELSEEEWKEKGISALITIGVLDTDSPVLDFHVEKVKKAYPAYFETYSHIDELIAYVDSIPNLYCVGRNGQHRYNNMDHSMMTSFEAVRNILASGQSDKSAIWNVNTEREYQEEK